MNEAQGKKLDVGDLSRTQLEIAAHLGHPGAQQTIGESHAPEDWIAGLGHWGREPVVRAAIACARWALPSPLGDDLQPVEDAVDAAGVWVLDPTEANRVGARLGFEDVERIRADLLADDLDEDLVFELEIAMLAARPAADSREEMAVYCASQLAERLATLGDEAAEVRELMKQSLLAWALGEADPLAPR